MEGRAIRLRETLPPLSGIAALEPRDQARAVLRCVFDLLPLPSYQDPIQEDPTTCPNCGQPSNGTRSPYCGVDCREEAGFVRQLRAGLGEGWMKDEEKQVALGQVLWHVLGGGRPFRQSIIPESSRRRALNRTEGKCDVCGAPATAFDHMGSGCNRDINLRAVCANCTSTHAFGDPAFLARPEIQARLRSLAERTGAHPALRVCDDAAKWDWRAYLTKRLSSAKA